MAEAPGTVPYGPSGDPFMSPDDPQTLAKTIDSSLSIRSRRRRSSLSSIFHRDRRTSVGPSETVHEEALDTASDGRAEDGDVDTPIPAVVGGRISLLVRKLSDLGRGTETEDVTEEVEREVPEGVMISRSGSTQQPGPSTSAATGSQDVPSTPQDVEPTKPAIGGGSVDLLAADKGERKAAIHEVAKQIDKMEPTYVWDILYENQRGIMLFGIPYFSSASLLPFDPPAYTIPSHVPHQLSSVPTPSASLSSSKAANHQVLASHQHPKHRHHRGRGHKKDKDREHVYTGKEKRKIKQSIKTPYTPQTYQLPSSEWKWLTPWMVNMRRDGMADEGGWEYNWIFRSAKAAADHTPPRPHFGMRETKKGAKNKNRNGWGCEVNAIGWGSWVRRRVWVRLRYLDPSAVPFAEGDDGEDSDSVPDSDERHGDGENEDEEDEKETGGVDFMGRKEVQKVVRALELTGKERADMSRVMREMGRWSLDREKLRVWKGWLADLGGYSLNEKEGEKAGRKEGQWERLKELLGDEENVKEISMALSFASSREQLMEMFREKGLTSGTTEKSQGHSSCL